MFPMIEVQQPQPNDIVGSRIHVAGFGTGFEATLQVRVLECRSSSAPTSSTTI